MRARATGGARTTALFAFVAVVCVAALGPQLVAAKSESCTRPLADKIVSATTLDRRLPDVCEARVSCADAAVSLLGVPYAYWAAACFAVCAIALLRILRLSA